MDFGTFAVGKPSNLKLLEEALSGDEDAQLCIAYMYKEGFDCSSNQFLAYAWACVSRNPKSIQVAEEIKSGFVDESQSLIANTVVSKLKRVLNSGL